MNEFKFDRENDVIVDLHKGEPCVFDKEKTIQESDILFSYCYQNSMRHILRMNELTLYNEHETIIEYINKVGADSKDIFKRPRLIQYAALKHYTDNPHHYHTCRHILSFLDGAKIIPNENFDIYNFFSCLDEFNGKFLLDCEKMESQLKEWIIVWGNDIGAMIAKHYTRNIGGGGLYNFNTIPHFDNEALTNLRNGINKSCAKYQKECLEIIIEGDY